MYPVGTYERMEYDLYQREQKRGTDIPITVGILLADYRQTFSREKIFCHLERFDKKSGRLMDFYIPGYYKGNKVTKYDIKSYMFKEEQYWFKSQYFDSFIEKIEKKGVIVTGNAQLLLVPYQDERLFFEKSIGVDLEKNVAEGNIVSLKLFFEELFTIAKKTTEFRTFVEQIENERKNDVDIFLKFLESKIAETLWSLFTSLILK